MFSEDFQKPRKKYSPKEAKLKEAKLKAADFCAYQERSQQEVRNKLYSYGLHKDEVEEVLSDLISDNFINEERFAKAYVGGKFRIKKWGRNKILHGLNYHRISSYCIKKGLQEIDEASYLSTLESIIIKKKDSLNISDSFQLNQKLAQYAIQRGYEPNIVWEMINSLS